MVPDRFKLTGQQYFGGKWSTLRALPCQPPLPPAHWEAPLLGGWGIVHFGWGLRSLSADVKHGPWTLQGSQDSPRPTGMHRVHTHCSPLGTLAESFNWQSSAVACTRIML